MSFFLGRGTAAAIGFLRGGMEYHVLRLANRLRFVKDKISAFVQLLDGELLCANCPDECGKRKCTCHQSDDNDDESRKRKSHWGLQPTAPHSVADESRQACRDLRTRNADLKIRRRWKEDTNRMELVQANEEKQTRVDLGGKEWYVGKAEVRSQWSGLDPF